MSAIMQDERPAGANETQAIVTGIVRVAESWGLTNAEAAALMEVAPATWSRMKAGTFRGRLDHDKLTRASLLVGLYKGLRLLFDGPLTHGWPRQPNTGPGFGGRTPVAIMIEGGIPTMLAVRRHIDALRGGV